MINKPAIKFPIIYAEYQISQEYFYLAVEKLQQKFDLDYVKAYDLASDIVKCLISENKAPESLAHYLERLV